jgi:hypothetical protein
LRKQTIPAIERQGRRAVNRMPLLLLVPAQAVSFVAFPRHFCGTPSTQPVWAKFRREIPQTAEILSSLRLTINRRLRLVLSLLLVLTSLLQRGDMIVALRYPSGITYQGQA